MNAERAYAAVVIGASAGGLDALTQMLPGLAHDFALPVFLVVHIPPDKDNAFPELLRARCKLDVREAEDKEPIKKGTVYMAPPNYHLLIEPDGRLSLSNEEEVGFSRPSIDVLFESAAATYGEQLIGIVLSGANDDGAEGLKQIEKRGGMALVQRPDTALSNTMPRAALAACPTALALSPYDLSAYLTKVGSHGQP